MRVSYSVLTSFNQCPLKYKWQYIDRIKVPTTPDLFFGSLVHEVLEFALKNGQIQPLEKSLEYFKNNWRSDVYKDVKSEQESYNSGREMIKNFYDSYKPGEIQVLSTEKFFEIYWQDHKIVGKIDRIDKLPTGEIEIIDYKTNKKLPCEDDFKYDYQLPLYAWAAQTLISNKVLSNKVVSNSHDSSNANDNNVSLRRAYPDSATRQSQNNSKIASDIPRNDNITCPPIKLTFYYLRFNKQIDPPNSKTLEELQSYILDTIYKIQKSKFEAKASNLCGWCEYLHMCPEGQNFISQKSKVKSQNENVKVKNNNENLESKSNIIDRKSKIIISPNQQSLF